MQHHRLSISITEAPAKRLGLFFLLVAIGLYETESFNKIKYLGTLLLTFHNPPVYPAYVMWEPRVLLLSVGRGA